MPAKPKAPTGAHLALGNTYRGILAGWVTAEILALAAALGDVTTDWRKTIAGMLLISGAPAGALIDRGSKPAKEDQPA